MKKLAIILDSFCGKNKSDVEKNEDFFYISLQIEIENQSMQVGQSKEIDKKIEKLLLEKKTSKTSMPAPGHTLEVFKKTSEKYENVIYLPLSSAISGTAKVAMGLSQNFPNISVIETHLVGKSFFEISKHLLKMANDMNENIEKIKTTLKNYVKKNASQAYVIPWTIDNLLKSGRINKITSNILERFKAVPVVSYEWDNKKLHNKGIKKSGKKAIEFALSKIENFIENKDDQFYILITSTPGKEIKKLLKKIFVNKKYKYEIEDASPIIASACGSNAISLSAYKNIENI